MPFLCVWLGKFSDNDAHYSFKIELLVSTTTDIKNRLVIDYSMHKNLLQSSVLKDKHRIGNKIPQLFHHY